jgi:hypothetical protein
MLEHSNLQSFFNFANTVSAEFTVMLCWPRVTSRVVSEAAGWHQLLERVR